MSHFVKFFYVKKTKKRLQMMKGETFLEKHRPPGDMGRITDPLGWRTLLVFGSIRQVVAHQQRPGSDCPVLIPAPLQSHLTELLCLAPKAWRGKITWAVLGQNHGSFVPCVCWLEGSCSDFNCWLVFFFFFFLQAGMPLLGSCKVRCLPRGSYLVSTHWSYNSIIRSGLLHQICCSRVYI